MKIQAPDAASGLHSSKWFQQYFLFQVIDTSFQLSIMFQSPHTAKVKVYHEMHLDRTCGLCGTCNRDQKDEFQLPNGKLVRCFETVVAMSWRVGSTLFAPRVNYCLLGQLINLSF